MAVGERARWAEPVRRLVKRAERRALSGRGILANRYIAGKLVPLEDAKLYAVVTRPSAREPTDEFPLPPASLRRRWAAGAEDYLQGGRRDVETMLETLHDARASPESIQRILDFGCAEGRMLRHLRDGSQRELWGVDINAERITWCQQHLAPPLRFATTTTMPHLPFADGYFDLIYAISVFTHISELADAWFLELLRVLRTGGYVYLTIHDEHSIDILLGRDRAEGEHDEMVDLLLRFDDETQTFSRDWAYFAVHADPGAQVFYRRDDLVRRWSQLAEFRDARHEAVGYQTGLLFAKQALPLPE
jgi:SAM-dependent methyltransferase